MRDNKIIPIVLVALAAALSGAGFLSCDGNGAGDSDGGTDAGPDASAPTSDLAECSPDHCGNGVVETACAEQCDDGNRLNHDGCDVDCTLSCSDKKSCDDGDDCDGTESCLANHTCAAGTPLADGASCGIAHICRLGSCLPTVCGDGITSAPEECDDANTDPADGCNLCRFTCVMGDAQRDCTGGDPCKGAGTCDALKHTCSYGVAPGDGTSCGAGLACKGGQCLSQTCGNHIVEMQLGESCDPPATLTCDASCHLVPKCGDGIREGGEDCDDGNTTRLDGCDDQCRFEQVQRFDTLKLAARGDAYCPQNQLGEAFITALALARFQSILDDAVDTGLTSILYTLEGGADITGTNAKALTIGVMSGLPAGLLVDDGGTIGDGGFYDPMHDLDWWYPVIPDGLGAGRIPKQSLMGSIVAKQLNLAGRMSVVVRTHSGSSPLDISSLTMRAFIGDVSAPTVSQGQPPGHLAAEHLNPSLKSFTGLGGANSAAAQLCGRTSAASINQLLLPAQFTGMGLATCGEHYPPGSSLLDLIVGGCTVLATNQVTRTQPDTVDAMAAPLGAGPPYTLVETNHRVTGCKDKGGAMVDLPACLAVSAYSSYFRFSSHRVIAR